jgi:NADH-quinone oxidoreductase subunit C
VADIETLHAHIIEHFPSFVQHAEMACGELTLEVAPHHLHVFCKILRDDSFFAFNMLIDVCGVDYLHYGLSEWETESATSSGFGRGVDLSAIKHAAPQQRRFAVVYHLLSLNHNHRVRLRAYLDSAHPQVDSVLDLWPAANWFEREAFDLYGIEFKGHPDLRRILTDYGFIGHPFRKDFPLIGNVEARYDATLQRVIYEPVSIEPRILEPKVIRRDNRYQVGE